MITVDEAKALILKHTIPLTPVNKNIDEVAGTILADHIYSDLDIPAFRQSSMDGYALRFEHKNEPLKIAGEMAAGTAESTTLGSEECSRIFTGAPLPENGDTVVMQEKITIVEGKVVVNDQNLQKGSNVREKGSEIKKGDLAMEKGSYLGPAAVGFLAGIGTYTLPVIPKPAISIILTGNELCKPGEPLKFGQVYESNSYSLTAALKQEGIDSINTFDADDKLEVLEGVLRSALEVSDVVLLTGGVSVGDYDFVIRAANNCGVEQIFHKVKQKPGKPLYFGMHNRKLVFGLPGNPSSVLSCYYNYVLPALKALSGKQDSVTEIDAKLTHYYKKPAGLVHFLKGRFTNGMATPLQAQESYRLSSFAQANCLIRLNETQESFEAGETVSVLLIAD